MGAVSGHKPLLSEVSAAERFWRRWLANNWTTSNATYVDDYVALTAALDDDSATPGTAVDLGREDVDASWTYSTKVVVQLVSTALVAFTVNRCAAAPRHRRVSF